VRNAAGSLVTALSTYTIDANWHHLVGVVDTVQSNITIYVDGAARTVASFNPTAGILSSTNQVVIGSRMSSATSDFNDSFNGNIQDVAFYNYALSASQVANHYYAAGIGPSIALPSSSTVVNEGTTLTVAAAVTGSPVLAYQWYDVTSGSPGTLLAGQTNSTLVITNIRATAYDGHYFELTVTNLFGPPVTSSTVYVQVPSGAPSLTAIAPPSLAAYAGLPFPAPFTVTAQGTEPFSYQWSTNGTPVPGATNAVFTNVALPAGSYTVGCQVTNSFGPGPLATASLVVAAVPTDPYGLTVLSNAPMAFWRLDEPLNATTAYDYVSSHNATYNNAVNGQPGFITFPSEAATVFGTNGISPSIAEENNNSANGIPLIDFATQGANAVFSVETWIQELPQTGDIICKGYPNHTQFALDGGGTGGAFRFVIHSSAASGTTIYTANSGSVLPDGNWHHLVGVCDEANGAIRMYADGKLKATTSVPLGSGVLSVSGSYPVVIAAQEGQNGSSFTGVTNAAMSQVALYNYALSASQIAAHYTAGTNVNTPTISAALSGTNLVITYTGTLVSATNVTDPITNIVAGAASPYTIPATNAQMYFRSKAL